MNRRAKLEDKKDPYAQKYLNCQDCEASDAVKEEWRCGWLSLEEGGDTDGVPIPNGYQHDKPSTCPGYLISIPRVGEAARAYSWRRDGALREFYDGQRLTQLTKNAIDIYATAAREVENWNIRGKE